MKAFAAFLIEAACFAGMVYFYIQNRRKKKAEKEDRDGSKGGSEKA